MRIIATLLLAAAAIALPPSAQAQPAPLPVSGTPEKGQSEATTDNAKSAQEKKEARKARREHRRAVNHRLRRKH